MFNNDAGPVDSGGIAVGRLQSRKKRKTGYGDGENGRSRGIWRRCRRDFSGENPGRLGRESGFQG